MNEIIRKIEAEQLKENAPEFHVGDTVKVYAKIKEGNRERIQVFEGTVLKLSLIHIQMCIRDSDKDVKWQKLFEQPGKI